MLKANRGRFFVEKLALVLAFVLLTATLAAAQMGGTAAVSGTVTDASGGLVPGVKITVTNTGTGIANSVASDSQGKYTLTSLAVGDYTVTAEKEGFQQLTQTGVGLSVGKNTIVDIVLRVGQVSQQVQVAAEALVVETQDSSLGMLVGAEQVKDLPLNGRSYISMATFSPGVTAIPSNTVSGFGEGTAMRLSVNGARQEGQVFLTDNTDTKGLWGNSTGAQLAGTTLGIDAISEFQVLTNTYGAQYGGNGTVINAAIRSGTNTFHGTVFDFERNSALDARNPFDPVSGPPPFYRHQFGGAVGGPIKKNKVFFFANYEGLRQNLGLTPAPFNVPDNNARQGLIPCYQAPGVTCDPTTNLANVAAAFPAAFATIKPILLTWPGSNGAELAGPVSSCAAPPCPSGAAFYTINLQQPVSENYGVGKLDYNFSSSDSLMLTYILDRASLVQPNYIPTQSALNNQMTNQVTIEEKKIISPTMINTAHLSYFRPQVTTAVVDTPALNILPGHFGGGWGVTGSNWSGDGGPGIIYSFINYWTGADQFFWTKGKHALQMGLDITRRQENINWPLGFQGAYTFPTELAFFQATPSNYSGPEPAFTDAMRGFRRTGVAPYLTDTYQITRRLTLTLGIRYDFMSNISEVHNKFTNITNLFTSTGFSAVPHAYYTNPTKTNIAPRVGFAWSPFGDRKTSVRGGFGMFYDSPIPSQLSLAYSTNPPYFAVNQSNPCLPPNPFCAGGGVLPARPSLSQGLLYGAPGEYPNHNPYLMQFNLNIQRQVFANTVFSIGYVGTQARHLYIKDNENTCAPTSIAANGYYVRGYTNAVALAGTCPMTDNNNFASMNIAIPRGTSNYNALQTSLVHNFSKGVEFQAAYTWSRCLSVGDNYTGGDSINIGSRGGSSGGLYPGFAVSSRGNQDHAPCDFNITHIFSGNVLYRLPFHGNRLVEGWQASLIASVNSGFLTTPVVGVDTALCGFNACAAIVRPNVVPGCDLYAGARTVGKWFNTACFSVPALGTFGNAGRNIIKNPGFSQFDFSVTKGTKISETTKLEIRAEIFNSLNHTNLGFPAFSLYTNTSGAPNATAGKIQDTAGFTSRQIQLGAKFIF